MSKKILVWIDSNFMLFCLSYFLQEKSDYEFYAIIDITNKTKDFFEKQNLVNFKKVWYYFDHIQPNKNPDIDYLSNFEKKYNVNLWKLAINERIFYRFNKFHNFSSDEILSIIYQECKLFETIFDEVKPDYHFTKETILHKDQLFCEMCKSKKIPILMTYMAKSLYKCVISQEAQQFDNLHEYENFQGKNRSFSSLREYLKQTNNFSKLQNYTNTFLNSKFGKLTSAKDFLLSQNDTLKTHYTYFGRTKFRVITHELISLIKKKYREIFIENNLLKKVDFNAKFVYFPLQMDQERNLLIAAPFYTNQIEIIKNIAKSLPVDYKLYVKEHSAQSIRGWRKLSEYEEIMKIPNVSLLHHSVSNEKLFQNCSLVVTIGGSPGLESTFYAKPSIVFIKINYSILPSVTQVKSIDELPKVIRQSLKIHVNSNDLDKYVSFLEENSVDFDWIAYQQNEFNTFFHGGNLIDVMISEEKMKSFIDNNKTMFESLTEGYIKKIKWFEKNENNKN